MFLLKFLRLYHPIAHLCCLEQEFKSGHYTLLPRDLIVPRTDSLFKLQKNPKKLLSANYVPGTLSGSQYILFYIIFYMKGASWSCAMP